MTMSPGIRKFALSVHLTSSVGWIGAVVAYLALVIDAMNSREIELVRSALIAMKLIGWYVIIPLAITSLITGIIMSLGTKWGLFQHYWVIFSLILTIFAVAILMQHMYPASYLIDLTAAPHNIERLRSALPSELLHSSLGLLVLLVIQVLNMYKPRGVTPFGWRKQQESRQATQS